MNPTLGKGQPEGARVAFRAHLDLERLDDRLYVRGAEFGAIAARERDLGSSSGRQLTETDIESIRISFTARGANPADNELILGAFTLPMKNNLVDRTDQTIGTVTGLSYLYDATEATLTVRKTAGTALSGAEVKTILDTIKLKNATTTGRDSFRVTVTLRDHAGYSSDATAFNIDINSGSALLDLNSTLSGVQMRTKKYLNRTDSSDFLLNDVVATNSASEIRLFVPVLKSPTVEAYDGSSVSTSLIGTIGSSTTMTIGGITNVKVDVDFLGRHNTA